MKDKTKKQLQVVPEKVESRKNVHFPEGPGRGTLRYNPERFRDHSG